MVPTIIEETSVINRRRWDGRMTILAFNFEGSAVKYGIWNGQEIADKGNLERRKRGVK